MADIGNTVKLQYNKLVNWADLVTVHSVSGGMMLEGIQEVINENKKFLGNRGVFIVAELSCDKNLISQQYTKGKFFKHMSDTFYFKFNKNKYL